MDSLFAAIESTSFSIWMRESPSVWSLPFMLVLHTWGLAFLVGASIAVDARVLGAGRSIPLASLDRYFAVFWLGFWINAASGLALLAAYPTKALTNPLFYLKLAVIAAAMGAMWLIRRHLRTNPASHAPAHAKLIAAVSLACWAVSIIAGRLLAYTYTRLTVDFAG